MDGSASSTRARLCSFMFQGEATVVLVTELVTKQISSGTISPRTPSVVRQGWRNEPEVDRDGMSVSTLFSLTLSDCVPCMGK